jgi:hypothetical protein
LEFDEGLFPGVGRRKQHEQREWRKQEAKPRHRQTPENA